MIDLYSWKSANGRRPIIILEETGTPYKIIPIDPHGGKNKEADYLKISPGGKVPCMVDPDGPGGRTDPHHGIGRDHGISRRENRPVHGVRRSQ